MATSDNFYAAIPPIHHLSEITELAHYRDVPDHWLIAITDVVSSTRAIERGRYKDVNAVAVASIAALLNLDREVELPFVFGGDGAAILIPDQLATAAKNALLATKQLAEQQFDLQMRVALVPVQEMVRRGHTIRIARLQVSKNFKQAIFMGDGLLAAERLIKTPQGKAYLLEESGNFQADFRGFECRWNKVHSPYEEVLSLMVLATLPDISQQVAIYQEVIAQVETIYGSPEQRHPITVSNMHMALNPQGLKVEARVRHQDIGWRRLLKMWRYSIMARIAMRFNIQGWGIYKSLLTSSTDHEKFDGTLRMTIAGSSSQREQLRDYLERKRQQMELAYGMHTSPYALITCIVYDYFGEQAHFIDAADGGYAMAAKQMKQHTMVMPVVRIEEEDLETKGTDA